MKKFLPYIERYIHWVALGLGALFVLYMVYSYVITPPVTATVGNKTVDLGNVDRVTLEGPARELQTAIQTGVSPTAIEGIAVQAPLPKFQKEMSQIEAPQLTASIWNAPITAPPIPGRPGTPIEDTTVVMENGTQPPQVKEFTPPAPIYVAISAGRSAVVPPPPPRTPNPNALVEAAAGAAGAAPAAPIQPIQPVQPIQNIQPAGGAPGAVAAANVPTIDKNWVNLHYRIPGGALADTFKNAGVPAVRSSTSFLRVELIRQEQLPDLKWGPDVSVPRYTLAFNDAPIWPDPPHENALQQQANVEAYITWAQSHAQAILQPPFYQVVKGDLAGLPGEPVVALGVEVKAFDPMNPGIAPPDGWTPEQMAQIREAQKQKALERRNNRPTPRVNPRGRGPTPGDDIAFAPRDNARPATLYQARNPYRQSTPEDMMMPEDLAMEGGVGGTSVVQQGNNEALNRLLQTIPNVSPFDPTQLVADIDVIAFDETAEPGKTYRYKMRYYILNPILGAVNLVKNPAFAQRFALPSEPSTWSEPVFIQPEVNFFLASGGLVGDSVKLDIYRWQNGDINKVSQNVVPGDLVGFVSRDGIDFTTPWTVVDVRNGNGDRYAILQNADGHISRREFKVDQQSTVKRNLDAQVAVAAAAAKAAAAANPTAPGTPAPPTPGLTR
jgi:hypothetical protein